MTADIDKYIKPDGIAFLEKLAATYPFRAFEAYSGLTDVAHAERPLEALAVFSVECAERVKALAAERGDDPAEVARAYAARLLALVKPHVRERSH